MFNKILNIIWCNISTAVARLFRREIPVRWITWEITSACNSRCQLCDIWKQKPDPGILTLEQIKKTFSDPLFKHLECVLLTGGEPVLRDDLLDIILFIHRKLPKVRFTLSTNAILPEKVLKVVLGALENGVGIDVGVSVDGVGEHHDRIRGVKGNFDKADHLIDELLDLKGKYKDKLSVVAGLTIHPLTVNYVKEVEDYANKKGVHFIVQLYDEAPYYYNVGKTGAGEEMEAERAKMLDAIERLRPSFHNYLVAKILKEKTIDFDCYAMRSFFILRANGDVMPCLRMCDVRIGNVKEKTPTEIWGSKEAEEGRKMARACRGCVNTWATDWSVNNNALPFIGLAIKFITKRLTIR